MTQIKTEPVSARRPLASRQHIWAHRFSTFLANMGVTPNQISFTSVFIALLGFGLLTLSVSIDIADAPWLLAGLYLAAALACQLRLLCNLMDGMVAVEAGKKTPDGELWNEFPDRLADVLFLLGVGMAANQLLLAWAVCALAILVAYVRELGKGIDGVSDFRGPMAKPQRMAMITIALLLCAIVSVFTPGNFHTWLQPKLLLSFSLWGCGVGCVLTVVLRIVHLQQRLTPSEQQRS